MTVPRLAVWMDIPPDVTALVALPDASAAELEDDAAAAFLSSSESFFPNPIPNPSPSASPRKSKKMMTRGSGRRNHGLPPPLAVVPPSRCVSSAKAAEESFPLRPPSFPTAPGPMYPCSLPPVPPSPSPDPATTPAAAVEPATTAPPPARSPASLPSPLVLRPV